MPTINWTEILKQRHDRYYADNGSQLVLGEPLPYPGIAEFQSQTGFQWSNQFFGLYTHHNGVGEVRPGEEVDWGFVPTPHLPEFISSVRDWFEETHPDVAKVYHPFFNWGSGDAIGYLDLPGISSGTLVSFEHEYYEFDAAQPWSEFLQPSHDSILSFLKI